MNTRKLIIPILLVLAFGGIGFWLAPHFGGHDEHAGAGAESSPRGQANQGTPPELDNRGFYTVGNYKIKVTVLSLDAMASGDAVALTAGSNRVQVVVLGRDDQPINDAVVRVAAQREAAHSKPMDSAQRGGSDEHAGKTAPKEHPGGHAAEHAGQAMPEAGDETQADEHAGHAAQMDHADAAMSDGAGIDEGPRNSELVTLTSAGDGRYRGQVTLPGDGDHVLAVDVTADDAGHGDLVLAFTTGEAGFKPVQATPENGQGIAYYTCSMHPSVREAGPGQCPICSMDLTPVSKEQLASGVITIDARRRQMIGVQTGRAQMRDLNKSIRAVGTVAIDERRVHNVALKFDAWIAELQADFVGVQVNKGQKLFSVYSPELLSAQQEYLETRQRLSARGSDDSLVQAARRRLMLWDISPAQVRALERRGQPLEYLPIYAPASGTVVGKMINEGSAMKTGDMLLRIADLSTVWVDAEVYEADLSSISTGMAATVTLPYQAGAVFDATVDFIYPYLSGPARTARIRLVLDNPDGVLKPDMYAEVKLQADLGRRLMVPDTAVLVAGESRVVFKDLGEGGKLKPVRVKTGQRVDNWVEIIDGLSPGDTVVTSGNFLIASEAKLKTGIEQW